MAYVRDYLTYYHKARTCPGNFENVGGTCLYLAKEKTARWDHARTYCKNLGGDLAVFKDANAFTAGLDYVKDQQLVRNTQIWIGATDRHRENHWKWITGQRITRVTPFWGKHYFSKQESTYDCGVLHGLDDYLMHDAACSSKYMPLCQIQ
nr:C-type lectin LmsL-like [Penaeus vannamei]